MSGACWESGQRSRFLRGHLNAGRRRPAFDFRIEAAGRRLDSRRDAGATQAQSRDLGSIFSSMSRGRFRNTALTPLRQRSSMPTTVHSTSGEM